jgi:hypothetical protein
MAIKIRREQELLRPGPEEPEQGRPWEHACDHFADDLRLAAAPRHPADCPAGREDEKHLQEERNGKFGWSHGGMSDLVDATPEPPGAVRGRKSIAASPALLSMTPRQPASGHSAPVQFEVNPYRTLI